MLKCPSMAGVLCFTVRAEVVAAIIPGIDKTAWLGYNIEAVKCTMPDCVTVARQTLTASFVSQWLSATQKWVAFSF